MYCIECGTKLPDNAKFCMNCGTPVARAEAKTPPQRAQRCIPGKRYRVKNVKEKDLEVFRDTEMGNEVFYLGYYTRLEDGTAVGWVYGHIEKYRGERDFYYNLYRVDPDGTATFLGAGERGGIESMFVQDGYAYWKDNWDMIYRTSIEDDEPAEEIDRFPD